jgi:hypothetical protein
MDTSPANAGSMRLNDDMTERLDLEAHPMVKKVRGFIADGWRIKVSKGSNQRKPYTKIFMFKGGESLTVQIDGSIKDHWD